MELIPIDKANSFKFRVEIAGELFSFRFYWSFAAVQWFVDMECETLGIVYKGFALVTGDDLLHGRGVREFGSLVLLDLQGNDDPEYEGLGERWKLYYLTAAERDELR